MSFEVIPAIDLLGGRVVRLRQGNYACETVFDVDPLELARRYADAGARSLHVVDLDGARAGRFENLGVIENICGSCALRVQAGGGVRDMGALQRLYAAGVARVVVGSVAVRDPDSVLGWLAAFGADRLVLALDARRQGDAWHLPVHGWTEESGIRLDALAKRYAQAGARRVLCTDIARDGTLGGFNLDLYRGLRALAPDLSVQASGGACSLDDIRSARAAGASAVILGRALLEQRFTLEEALAC